MTVDSRIVESTILHHKKIHKVIKQLAKIPTHRPLRFLEVGANAHYTGQLLASGLDVDATMLDISSNALRHGQELAIKQGYNSKATLVACDYHELPFHSSYFDVVFIAAAVHHSQRPEVVLPGLRSNGGRWGHRGTGRVRADSRPLRSRHSRSHDASHERT